MGAVGLGIPAADARAYYQTKRSDLTLMWLISTRMLPPVGVIVPLFVIFRDQGLRDNRSAGYCWAWGYFRRLWSYWLCNTWSKLAAATASSSDGWNCGDRNFRFGKFRYG